MSWETLVVGGFKFKDGTSAKERERVIAELDLVLETAVKWDEKWQEYCFEAVNWTSHVKGEEIKEVVERNKTLFEQFETSLYYLSEADEQINLEPGSDEVEAMLC